MGDKKLHLAMFALMLWALGVAPAACGSFPLPTLQPPPTSTFPPETQPTVEQGCLDRAALDGHVTVPPGTALPPGQPFVKTWRLVNTGTCTWSGEYALTFAGGQAMDGPPAVALPATVPPNGTVELSVTLLSPADPGPHEGAWLLRNAGGETFGLGETADQPLVVRIVVEAALPTATAIGASGPWRGEYYDNRELTGRLVLLREDPAIDFDWGNEAPAPELPADRFSVRWTRTLTLAQGTYRFYATADDGVRAWIDEQPLLDEWHGATRTNYWVQRDLAGGEHSLRVEYYDDSHWARIQFWWDRVGYFPEWRGEYYPNTELAGEPLLVRNDASVSFDWQESAPIPELPADGFSVRWTRVVTFTAGLYRFRAMVDDGMRLWVDDQLILDAWRDGARREVVADRALTAGSHNLQVEYYDRRLVASIDLRWETVTE